MNSNQTPERIYFQKLKIRVKHEVEIQLKIRKEFKDWSGYDIQNFQDDLEVKCKSTVSEKWFYNHFKNENEKLPRVDVLNLLSFYCGYKNWDDFKFQNETKTPSIKGSRSIWLLTVLILVMGASTAFWMSSGTKNRIIICHDAYTHEPILAKNVQLEWGGVNAKISNTTSVIWSIKVNEKDTLFVDGAYYKAKKVVLNPDLMGDTLIIELLPDDYALMLNYFSRATSSNWEKRSKQLREAIHDDAKLFQVHEDLNGIEMLNKQEFIDRLILPVNSLKNLEILHIVYKDNQIYRLRFVQKIK